MIDIVVGLTMLMIAILFAILTGAGIGQGAPACQIRMAFGITLLFVGASLVWLLS